MEEARKRKEQLQESSNEKQLMLSYPPTDTHSYPWLVICDGKDKERQTFFSISKNYCIHFNISFYNTPNIKDSIILPLHLNILFLFFLYIFK